VFHSGTAGDIVTAVLDPGSGYLTNGLIRFYDGESRTQLKVRHIHFPNDTDDSEALNWLATVACNYPAIASHDIDFHIKYQHKFLLIVVDQNDLQWVLNRLTKDLLLREHRNVKLHFDLGLEVITQWQLYKKHAENVIAVGDIRSGKLIQILNRLYPNRILDEQLYADWLLAQHQFD
jgi:hypothetical protein